MQPKNKRRKSVFYGLLILFLGFCLLLSLEVFSRFFLESSSADFSEQTVYINIPIGAGLDQVSDSLVKAGLVEHPLLFRFAAKFMRADTKIQAGLVPIPMGLSILDIIKTLTQIRGAGIKVAIVEGMTTMEIAGLLAKEIQIDSTDFMVLVKDTFFVRELGLQGPSLEGYLFPDTYSLAVGIDPKRVASRMVSNFMRHLPQNAEKRAAELGLTLHQAITLASIVEWEVQNPSEAKTVSSVYHNRLRKNMPLQADPTVAYALGKGPSRLYYSDLKYDSPYNTYKYTGLPPGPINNPGERSIEAALNPANTGYIFFVAQGNGSHAFTATLSEHLVAKQTLDSLRREASRSDSTRPG